MSEREQTNTIANNISIQIEWHEPETLTSPYASNVFVQAGEYEFIISFFQTRVPLLTGTPEENLARIKEIGSIQAECVGRVIVSPDLVPKIIESLQSTLDNYHAIKKSQREAESAIYNQ